MRWLCNVLVLLFSMVFAHERRRYGTKTVSRRKWWKITIINAKWKTWKTTQEMRSSFSPPPPTTNLYCVDENVKFCLVRFFLINTHTVLALQIQLSNFFHSNIVLHTVFAFVIFHFPLIATFFFDMFAFATAITVLLFLLLCARWCWWRWRRWRRSDRFLFYTFLCEIIYSLAILFTVSIYLIRCKRKNLLSSFFFGLFFLNNKTE